MKIEKVLGIIGSLLLISSGFFSLASIDSKIITIFPVFDNFEVGESIWFWRDISAFAITFPLIALVSLYFVIKENYVGLFVISGIAFGVMFFILISVWMASEKSASIGGIDFSYDYGWIIILIGIALLIFDGFKIKKEQHI